MVQVLDYEPYGEQTLSLDYGTQGSPYSYTGKELDPSSGLYYYEARWYDPETGHFISTDPFPRRNPQYMIPDPARWNEYAYARGNPINYNDPSGEDGVDVAEGYVVGLFEGAWNALESAASVIMDPLSTAASLGSAILDLPGTVEAIAQSAEDTWGEFVNGDDYTKGEMIGEVVGGAAIGFGVGKLAEGTNILNKIVKGANLTKNNSVLKNWDKFGGYEQALKDLEELAKGYGAEIKDLTEGVKGFEADGVSASVRNFSSEASGNRPTLQVDQVGQATIKVRYDN